MKILITLCAIFAVSSARVVITAEGPANLHRLGEQECTWGPSYWCENIKTAAGCNATAHCIKTMWKDMNVPEDNDSVCNICKDMVQQARDQLESNQTQEDLKAVFEGSCRLIHVIPIVKECITIVDQFIPELVETLASQMNPSLVCSVAGLCNSAHMDKLLVEYGPKVSEPKATEVKSRSLEKDEYEPDECSKCFTVAAHMEHKLNNTPREKVFQQMLNLCAELGTYSDACSAIVITYFDTIYAHLQENFNAQNICHLSGQCSAKFHKHEDADKILKVEIRPLSSVGMVDVNDDLPCMLCKQLVGHLKDLLVANTTETEFKEVLKGLCKQTKSFSTECLAIVDEYYPQIYEYLTKTLNSDLVCQISGMCLSSGKALQSDPIWPLVPKNVAEVGMRIFQGANKNIEPDNNEQPSKTEIEAMQLPIERLVPFPMSEGSLDIKGTEKCALCEYILHFIQETITNPDTEDKVKEALGKVCKKLPESIADQCTQFVDLYGDAVVAILAQEIDPSQVCPMLHLCPNEKLMELWQSIPTKYMLEEKKDKPTCPLCLLAMSQIYEAIKNNRTEKNIENQLDKLCVHLPHSLVEECTDLVKGYSKEIIELLLADLTPQEVCVYIKLCDASKNSGPSDEFITDKDGEILTNEIPNDPVSSEISENVGGSPYCVICEFAMHYVDKVLANEKEKHKVEKAVHDVCNHLPKSVSRDCNDFVNKYAATVIDVITKDVSPKQVCTMLAFCSVFIQEVKASVEECAMCKSIISVVDEIVDHQDVDNSIRKIVPEVCKYLPSDTHHKCITLVSSYGESIINLVKQREPSYNICGKMALCASNDYSSVSLETSRIKRSYEKNRIKHCTWGPVYWCSSNETARECKAVEHCKENVWKADFAPPKQITLSEKEPNV
ncbi:prosaposin [Frieseomelitta varia]|uniref:prosaposin n=1 Tax=Frieseomelitta varia TaxID=561572 RepID=UPI001CB6AEB7|nr:prosaposin [Frieseomelitta varia]XP_043511578.1 prosaposin [Frieseomelitta varia]